MVPREFKDEELAKALDELSTYHLRSATQHSFDAEAETEEAMKESEREHMRWHFNLSCCAQAAAERLRMLANSIKAEPSP